MPSSMAALQRLLLLTAHATLQPRCNTLAFVEWARAGGATISPHISLQPLPDAPLALGVFARAKLHRSTTAARVPYSLLFSPLWCHHAASAKAAIARVKSGFAGSSSSSRTAAATAATSLNPTEESAFLLAFEAASKDASFWAPWIRCLPQPSSLSTPTFWDSRELLELQHSPLRGWVDDRRDAMRRSRLRILDALAGCAEWPAAWPPIERVMEKTRWEWALTMVFTRGFSVPWGGQGRSVPALVPFGGMLNFDPNGHNVVSATGLTPNSTKYTFFEFATIDDVAPGVELRAQYGASKASIELLFDYGFAYVGNAADYLMLPLAALLGPFLEAHDAARRDQRSGVTAKSASSSRSSPFATQASVVRRALEEWGFDGGRGNGNGNRNSGDRKVVLQQLESGAPSFANANDLLVAARLLSRAGVWDDRAVVKARGTDNACAAAEEGEEEEEEEEDAYDDEEDELGGMGLRYRLRYDAAHVASLQRPLRRAAEEAAALRMAASFLEWVEARYATSYEEDASLLRQQRDGDGGGHSEQSYDRFRGAVMVRMAEKELLRTFATALRSLAERTTAKKVR